MNYQDDLLERTREKLRGVAKRLDDELSRLQTEGLLTPLDKQKMIADGQTSSRAILDALNRDDYPHEMQKELIKRLIVQFENSVDEIINQAKLRKYSRPRLVERFSAIESDLLRKYSNLSDKDINKARTDFRRLQNTFITRIELLINRGSVKDTNIEPLFEQYRGDATAIVLGLLPKLGAAEEDYDRERPISASRRESTSSHVKLKDSKEGFIKLDDKDVEKKTLLTERRPSGIKIAVLIFLVFVCLLELVFFKPLLFLFRFLVH